MTDIVLEQCVGRTQDCSAIPWHTLPSSAAGNEAILIDLEESLLQRACSRYREVPSPAE
ncbi:hypothetical protein SAFG77S_13457 [Streptomyces afghaniensis]